MRVGDGTGAGRRRGAALAAILLAGAGLGADGLAGHGARAATIDILGGYETTDFANSAVFGQSFVVGAESTLLSVTATARSRSGTTETILAQVFGWSEGTRTVTTAPLFETTFDVVVAASPQPAGFVTGGLALTEGASYIVSFRHADGAGFARFGRSRFNVYGGGAFWESQSASYTTASWTGGGSDLEMTLEFGAAPPPPPTPVPLPAGLSLGAAGLAMLSLLGLGRRRRRRKRIRFRE